MIDDIGNYIMRLQYTIIKLLGNGNGIDDNGWGNIRPPTCNRSSKVWHGIVEKA